MQMLSWGMGTADQLNELWKTLAHFDIADDCAAKLRNTINEIIGGFSAACIRFTFH